VNARLLCAAAVAALLAVPCAAAQNPASVTAQDAAIVSYPASYFAGQHLNTALDMVKQVPGFTLADSNNARGFAGTAGNVVIDGQRPTSKTDDLESVLGRIPASEVERIDLVRGGAPGVDMQGQTVVANVVRRKTETTKVVVDVEDNIWADHHAPQASIQFTHRAGESTYDASLTRIGNFSDAVGKGFHDITDVSTGTVTHQDARMNGVGNGWGSTAAASVPLLGGQFKANLALQDLPWHSANFYTSPAGDETITDRSSDQSAELGLHWIGKIGAPELETLVLQRLDRQTDRNADDAPALDRVFTLKNKSGESIARATLRYAVSTDLRFEGAAEGAYNFLNGATAYSENGVAVPLPSANANVNEKRGEVFAQATWKFMPDWTLEAGARFEFSTISETGDVSLSRSFFYPKPRVLLTWAPSADDQLRLRYEKVLGQLDFGAFVASASLSNSGVHAGNAQMKPDQHSQIEFSYEHHFWDKGALVVSFLHEDIADVMDYIPVTGSSGVFDAPGNIGAAHSNEINSVLTLPLDKIGLDNGLLKITNIWRFSGVRDPATGDMRRISGQRPNNIHLELSQDIESLKSTWIAQYFHCWDEYYARATIEQHARCVPPYIVLAWKYKPTPDWSLTFEVMNLGRFDYDNINRIYAGERGSSPLVAIEETKFKSEPRLFIQIRKTFE
jgi:outer membrane receptor protein involved in Fe transport